MATMAWTRLGRGGALLLSCRPRAIKTTATTTTPTSTQQRAPTSFGLQRAVLSTTTPAAAAQQQQQRPYRLGMIGAGDISALHYEGIQAIDDAELHGLWTRSGCAIVPDPELRAREYNCRLYHSPETLVADPDIDAVLVLTPVETHLEYARMALRAGKPVLVEKPVGDNAKEIEELRDEAERAGVPCVPGHN
eukprot:UC1_evm2s1944